MYSVLLPKFLIKSNLKKITLKVPTFWNLKDGLTKRNYVSAFKSAVSNDIVLYKLEKSRYFFYLKLFSVVNCCFWVSNGINGLDLLKYGDAARERMKHLNSFLSKFYTGTYICAFAVIFGLTTTALINFYVLRSIRKIILHKGGKNVTITTFSVPGFKNEFKIPLNNISAVESNRPGKAFLSLKVKSKPLYYLIDNEGEFTNQTLFNRTVGIQRSLD